MSGLHDVLAGFICLLLVPLGASLYLRERERSPRDLFLGSMLGQLFSLTAALLYMSFRGRLLSALRFGREVFLAILLTSVASFLITTLISLIKRESEEPIGEMAKSVRISILAASALVIAPLTEELMFRGLIMLGMAELLGNLNALLLSSLVFAVSHAKVVSIRLIPAIFVQGLIFGLPVTAVRSLIPSIVAHSFGNLPGVILTWKKGYEGQG